MLCEYSNLGIAYKDSDFTVVITIVCWPKHNSLVLKFTLVVELWELYCFSIDHHCSSVASTFIGITALERPKRILTTLPWLLLHVKIVDAVLIIFLLSGCVNWNKL